MPLTRVSNTPVCGKMVASAFPRVEEKFIKWVHLVIVWLIEKVDIMWCFHGTHILPTEPKVMHNQEWSHWQWTREHENHQSVSGSFWSKNDDWGGLISASSADSCVHPILSHTHKLVCVWPYTRSGCWELFCNNIHTCNSPMGLGAFGPFGSLVWGSHDINLGGNERCGKGRIRLQELE